MKGSSLHKVNYRLRPAKNIERKMFCEAFLRLSRLAPLPDYRYVGFGSIGFCDFSLFHQRLGITDMISIEALESAKERVKFNRPYDCIDIRWGTSHIELPKINWKKRSIIWLDYDRPLDAQKLEDISLVTSSAQSGSVLLVTVPADPGDSADIEVGKRLEKLVEAVGEKKIPSGVKIASLAGWGMARVCRRIITNEILSTLNDRNGANSPSAKIDYVQLFNFNYADGPKMLTVGGLLLDGEEKLKLSSEHFDDLDFISTTKNPYRIETPYFTMREMRYLDNRLPGSLPEISKPTWLRESDKKKYGKVYRYYPNFSEVEA